MLITFDIPPEEQSRFYHIWHMSGTPLEATRSPDGSFYTINMYWETIWANYVDWIEWEKDTITIPLNTPAEIPVWKQFLVEIDNINELIALMQTKVVQMKDAFKDENKFRDWF